jgi:hypothetical protein
VLGAQQLMETVYQLVSRDDDETLRILDDVIILAVHANPDGMDLVSDWYMRNDDPQRARRRAAASCTRSTSGHDNNRDFYASTQAETENMNRVMYTEWYPQIVYNHHQTGPAGTVMFAPPFRDPFNYNYDPLVPTGIDMVGAAMHNRFVREDKPGVTMRSGANYSTWWNGGLRTTPYFHNMIGLLTETIGSPTPMDIPFIPQRQLPHTTCRCPIEPQRWHFRKSVDYSVTANYAVLDSRPATATRSSSTSGGWAATRSSAGSRDTLDALSAPHRRVRTAIAAPQPRGGDADGVMAVGRHVQRARAERSSSSAAARPRVRDARGYILSADQPDFPTAAKFVDALLETGVHVHRATREFTVAGAVSGRLVRGAGGAGVPPARARHVRAAGPPGRHPYPGGPPIPPYDNAGWTLAFQMGVEFDRILDGFDGPFEKIDGVERGAAPRGAHCRLGNAGYLLSPRSTTRSSRSTGCWPTGHVSRARRRGTAGGRTFPAGTFFIAGGTLRADARSRGDRPHVHGSRAAAGRRAHAAAALRIALWDRYGGSMPSGWTRWLFEQFEFPFEVVYPQTLDAGDLNAKYDAIVFVTGAIPSAGPGGGGGRFGGGGGDASDVPAEYQHMVGSVTAERTIPRCTSFWRRAARSSPSAARPAWRSTSACPCRTRSRAWRTAASGRCLAPSTTCPARSSRFASITICPSPTA